MKPGTIVIDSYTHPKTKKKVWTVSAFRRYLEVCPGMMSACYDQLKGGFSTRAEATAWAREYRKNAE